MVVSVSPNAQQRQAIKHSKGPLLIVAGAGTGKTTVITERIKFLINKKNVPANNILAVTFTDKAAGEMLERLDVVMPLGYEEPWLSTFHSFCDRILKAEGLEIGLDPSYRIIPSPEQWILIRKHLFDLKLSYYRPLGNPTKFISALLTFFSRSQDENVLPDKVLKFAQKKKARAKTRADKDEAKKNLEVARAYQTYTDLKQKESLLDFGDLITHTIDLFKKRQNILRKYQQQFSHILVDEFQDTNYAQYELLKLLAPAKTNPNLIVVGDDDQCLPATAKIDTPRGQVRIKDIKVGDSVITAVGKGYLSSSRILHVHKTKKRARFITFVTESGKKLTLTDNHKMFCLIPGRETARNIYYVYLMWRKDIGWRLGITNDLAVRLRLERSADKILAVKSYPSLQEALLSEAILSLKYQIPTYPFKPRRQMKLTGQWLEKLYSHFDTEQNAQNLASDLGIDLNSHHFCLDGVVRGNSERVKVILQMCYRRYSTKWAKSRLLASPQVAHAVRIDSSSIRTKTTLEAAGIKTQKGKKGWRLRRQFTDLLQAGKFAQNLAKVTGGFLEVRCSLGKRNKYSRPALVMPAKNVLVGMRLPVRQGHQLVYEKVVRRHARHQAVTVYDLEVDRTHNFIADGIAVHNSIYKFRGAAISNILDFKSDYLKAKTVVLTQNYRSVKPILAAAYNLIQHNNPDRLEVKLKLNKQLKSTRKDTAKEKPQIIKLSTADDETDWVTQKIIELTAREPYTYKDFAILARSNNQLEPFVATFRRHGLPYQLVGNRGLFDREEVRQLIYFLKIIVDPSDSTSLFQFLYHESFNLDPTVILNSLRESRNRKISLWQMLEREQDTKIEAVVNLIKAHQEKIATTQPTKILYSFLQKTALLKELSQNPNLENELSIKNINLFLSLAKLYEGGNHGANAIEFVDHLDLLIEAGENPAQAEIEDVDTIRLITVHSAKGLEFPVVFIPGLITGRFPSISRRDPIEFPEKLIKETLPKGDEHLQEERRLLYVGITRARDYLYLSWSKDVGGVRARYPSGFLQETELPTVAQDVSPELNLLVPKAPKPPRITRLKRGRVDLKYVSYSQIDTFNTCPLKYKYRYILQVPARPHHALTFGQSIHDTLRHFHQFEQKGQKVNLKDLMYLYKRYFREEGYDSQVHKKARFLSGQKALKKYFQVYKTKLNQPLLLEKSFLFKINGIPLIGKIDRIDKVGDTHEIIDYKTGEAKAQKKVDTDDQLSIYALASRHALNIKPEKLSLYFLETNKKVTTTRSEKDLKKTFTKIHRTIDDMKRSDFPAKPGYPFPCGFCEYNRICPFAAKRK